MSEYDYFPDRVEFVIDKLGGPSEFARSTGVTLSTIARWRKGEAEPSRPNLVKMAEVANVSLEWLATGRSYEDEYKIEAPRQELSVKEAIEALEQAIARLPAVEPEIDNYGMEFSDEEIMLILNYRMCGDIEKAKIEATAEAFASVSTSADEHKTTAMRNVA